MKAYGEFAVEVRVSGDRFRFMQLRRLPRTRPLTFALMPKGTGKRARQRWVRRNDAKAVLAALEDGARGEL